MAGVLIRNLEAHDPRCSKEQALVIERLAKDRPEARLLGFDKKQRPVVTAPVGIPQTWQNWAILRNGDPTDVTEPVVVWGDDS